MTFIHIFQRISAFAANCFRRELLDDVVGDAGLKRLISPNALGQYGSGL
jgi:hypothetical protein